MTASPAPGFRLGELAAAVGGTVDGDDRHRIEGLRTLEHAGVADLSFANDASFAERARASAAGAGCGCWARWSATC